MGKWSLHGQREGTSVVGGASGRIAFSQSPVSPFSPSPPGTQVLITPLLFALGIGLRNPCLISTKYPLGFNSLPPPNWSQIGRRAGW